VTGLVKAAYEQNYQHFRSLNQIMWQIPVLATTLTGGLWFGVTKIEEDQLACALHGWSPMNAFDKCSRLCSCGPQG